MSIRLSLVMLVGLTGVGKSHTIDELFNTELSFTLLPNRRELTDRVVIPEMQRAHGYKVKPVTDRLERFKYTRMYREAHPAGMVQALGQFLVDSLTINSFTLVFDNLRGFDEVKNAADRLANTRFVVFDAPAIVRLQRLLRRRDSFDQVSSSNISSSDRRGAIEAVPGALDVFELDELLAIDLGRFNATLESFINAVRIIVGEQQNYDHAAAKHYLEQTMSADRLLVLDTTQISPQQAAAAIAAWVEQG